MTLIKYIHKPITNLIRKLKMFYKSNFMKKWYTFVQQLKLYKININYNYLYIFFLS